MKVYTNIDHLPAFKKAVLTIGTFDGVHQGHQQIIEQLIKEAAAIGGTPVVISFFPHPKQVIAAEKHPGIPIQLLNTPEEKYELLHEHGIKNVVVVPFNKAFAEQPADAYIRDFLVQHFHPHTIIIGYDHRFGKNRKGDYHLLEQMAPVYEYRVKESPEHVLKNITISSTRIRAALLAGDIDTAAGYLGYRYFFSGQVIMGNQLGRTIGFPTANLLVNNEQKLIPANGVYAVGVELEGRSLKGMMNIGLRPTVDGSKRVIEVNIFDFDEMIYGSTLKITMVKQLRSEVKFNGLEELKAQLALDKKNALSSF
jgi:riboflavin kinase/FMN adenylyltransferase